MARLKVECCESWPFLSQSWAQIMFEMAHCPLASTLSLRIAIFSLSPRVMVQESFLFNLVDQAQSTMTLFFSWSWPLAVWVMSFSKEFFQLKGVWPCLQPGWYLRRNSLHGLRKGKVLSHTWKVVSCPVWALVQVLCYKKHFRERQVGCSITFSSDSPSFDDSQ